MYWHKKILSVFLMTLVGLNFLNCASPVAGLTFDSSERTQLVNFIVPKGTTDKVFEDIDFIGTGFRQAALTINTECSNITFRNCTARSESWNAVTINDYAGNIRDITFEGLIIYSSGRMGFECTSRGSTTKIYQRIVLRNVVVEPQGNEGISFDGPSGVAADCTLDGIVIKGAGNNLAEPYGQGFEINGPSKMTINNMTIYRTRGSMLNLNCSGYSSNWRFTNCTFDASTSLQPTPMDRDARVINANGMNRAVFENCVFNAGGTDGAYNNGWLSNCSNNDFTTSRLLGLADNAHISLAGKSTGNLLP